MGLPAADKDASAQTLEAGRKIFEQRCATCHGGGGGGGEMGPPIAVRLSTLADMDLATLVQHGRPLKGMPGAILPELEMAGLLKFLRALQEETLPIIRPILQTTEGRTLEGQVLGEGFHDLQLLTDDKRVHLLRRAGERYREVTSTADWPTYNGDPGGNRHTTLTQIDKTTVTRLAPRWVFSIPEAGPLQVTPVVVDGIMYVTAPNECFALDAGSGRPIWHYKRPRTKGVSGGGANRGVGVAGDRVFMVTDHAHLIALDRFTGELRWDTPLDDWRKNYAASSAPLVAGDLGIPGVPGGEVGAHGLVSAH